MGAPDSYFNKTSLWYAFGDIPLNNEFIDQLATFSGDEDAFRIIIRNQVATKKSPTLGNALMLTEEIYSRWKNGSKIPDFNLDADRGYPYTCWTQRSNEREEPKRLEQNRQREVGDPITPVDLQFIAP